MMKSDFTTKPTVILVLISLVATIFSPQNADAKRSRSGARLVVLMANGKVFKGELLRVRKNTLLIMQDYYRTGVVIELNSVDEIAIIKGSKVLNGLFVGSLAAGLAGEKIADIQSNLKLFNFQGAFYMIGFGMVVGYFGPSIGLGIKSKKRYKIWGRPERDVKRILKILNGKARFPEGDFK